jgi:hypothetical protein
VLAVIANVTEETSKSNSKKFGVKTHIQDFGPGSVEVGCIVQEKKTLGYRFAFFARSMGRHIKFHYKFKKNT